MTSENERSAAPPQNIRQVLQGTSLPGRTLAGFIAAILAVLVIALVTLQSVQSRAASGRKVAQTLEVMQHIEALLSTLKDAETGQRGYLLSGDEAYLEPYNSALRAFPRELAAAHQLLGESKPQLARLGALEHVATEKLNELAATIALKRSGRSDAAFSVVRGNSGIEAMNRIRSLVTEMKAAEQAELSARNQTWERSISASAALTWGGSALLLFLIIASAVMSSRDFREQRLQAWLRSGQNELSGRMQGNQGVEQLGEAIVAFLAKYIDAQLGGLYYTDTAQHLKRIGSYGLPKEGVETEPGGLTRQALRDNALLRISDVPDDFFPVSAGLGQSRPRHLLLAPTSVDGAPNGVLEFGFFRPIEPAQEELLRRVSEPIGVSLRAARYRRELQNLLEETQRQSEELQTQQEELRVQNEELEQQTHALQQSKERLQNQQAELEQINTQLEEQAQELEIQRDDLTNAQGELQRANTYKSEFLANMSHELRTPLNSSLILAKLLMDNREGNLNTEQVKFAQTIYSAGNDLLTLINDILDLSKIEAGKLDVRPEKVTISRLLQDLEGTFRPIAQERRLDLALSVEEGTPASIETDATRLQQILKNLLSNALKFTERGGVTLSVHRERDGRFAFAVRDTGIGIPADQHETVFEAFRQIDGTANRKRGGTGLGLSISRDLARLLGGELTLESEPGRGSTFTLLLPEQHSQPAEDASSVGASAELRPAARPAAAHQGNGQRNRNPIPVPAIDDRDNMKPGVRAILVIEDDVAFANIIKDLAHELDFQALLAHNAEEGLAMAERYQPSAIVLDVGLPDRSGLSVLDTLKHNAATRHIPVHVVSASDYTHTALEMGAAGYAVKPIERKDLIEALKHLETKFTKRLRRVLVVEDDESLRDSTCRLLASGDVETTSVGTADAALSELRQATFDCMVLDLSLPDRSGFDLLEEMSQKDQYSFPPVVVYTGRSLSREEEQRLRRFSHSIVIKGARSPERLLDEVTLFLHQVETELPPDRQRMLRDARHREAVFEGRRVLVVEDDVRNIFALSSVLEPKGAKVEIARNGREALTHLKEKPGVDLILMDVMMPEMDGLQATREIRKQPELAKLPIIALTAKAMADDREQCLLAGANDYVAKPLDVDKLLSLARVWMPK
jgi:CheY-like chemotaxis protein